MSLPITLHFDLDEFKCKDGTPYPTAWIQDRLMPLCRVLEEVRAACGGKVLSITSGFRTEQYNKKINGARSSRHVQGDAADIKVNGMAPSDVQTVILQLVGEKKIKIGGLGIYPRWVHVDTRPWIGHLAQWRGSGIGSEVA